MQKELEAAPGARPIRILGVNETGRESGNPVMTRSLDLPWLQDTAEADVWTAWSVTARDVVVLGPDGRVAHTFNVTENSLLDAGNYAALKDLLRQAAQQ